MRFPIPCHAKRSMTAAAAVSVLLVLAGCAALARTPYQQPAVPLPAHFEHSDIAAGVPRNEAWWRSFDDPQLNGWIDLALQRNPDLAIAGFRARRASLEAQLAGNALRPVWDGALSSSASRALSGENRRTNETVNAQIGVRWEIDLFDRLGAQRDATGFEARASAQDREAIALSLVAAVANLYWQIGFANERIASAMQSLAYSHRTRELIDAQYRAGSVSRLELREVEQSVAEQQALLSQLVQTSNELRQALMVLFDGSLPPGPEPLHLPDAMPAPVGAGLPAELLGRRPDLRAAELRLRASLASRDATAARFYPTFSLTGSLGTSSASLLEVLRNPVATLGSEMALPFLNLRGMQLSNAVARTRHEEAILSFRKSLYAALAEVERALSARTQLSLQALARRRARDEATESEMLYEVRYRKGQVALRAWLDAQERRRVAEVAHASIRLALLQNHMTLNQVLGGAVPPMDQIGEMPSDGGLNRVTRSP